MTTNNLVDAMLRTSSALFALSAPKRNRNEVNARPILIADLSPAILDVDYERAQRAIIKLGQGAYFASLLDRFPRAHVIEYARFLALKMQAGDGDSPGTMLSASRAVDTVWHAHMLLPQSYVDMCTALLGTRALPGGGVTSRVFYHNAATAEAGNYVERYQHTRELYAAVFGAPPPEDVWPVAVDDGGDHAQPGIVDEPADIITVRLLTGNTLSLDIDPETTTVAQLQRLIQDREGIPPHQQKIIFQRKLVVGSFMQDSRVTQHTLSSFGIKRGDTLFLVLRL